MGWVVVNQNHLWGFGNQYMLITCTPTSAPYRDSSAPKTPNAHHGIMPPAEDRTVESHCFGAGKGVRLPEGNQGHIASF